MKKATSAVPAKPLLMSGAFLAASLLVVGATSVFGGSEAASAGPEVQGVEYIETSYSDYGIADLDVASRGSSVEIPDLIQPENLGNGGLNVDSARYLGEANGSQYWAALDQSGRLCLVAYIAGENWVAGTGCQDPEAFSAYGANLRISGPEGDTEAYLVNDANDEASSKASLLGGSSITQNLFVVPTSATADERASFKAELEAEGIDLGVIPQSRAETEATLADSEEVR